MAGVCGLFYWAYMQEMEAARYLASSAAAVTASAAGEHGMNVDFYDDDDADELPLPDRERAARRDAESSPGDSVLASSLLL